MESIHVVHFTGERLGRLRTALIWLNESQAEGRQWCKLIRVVEVNLCSTPPLKTCGFKQEEQAYK